VYRGTAGEIATIDGLGRLDPGLVIDAVIGYSLGGAPRGPARDVIEWATEHEAPVLSLDVPSGVDSTSGEAPGAHIRAATTMTLALPKTGLDAAAVGDLWLADIGIPAEVYRRVGIAVPSDLFGDRYRVPIHPV
jgi:NAD(P)H-hydrate epimerase